MISWLLVIAVLVVAVIALLRSPATDHIANYVTDALETNRIRRRRQAINRIAAQFDVTDLVGQATMHRRARVMHVTR